MGKICTRPVSQKGDIAGICFLFQSDLMVRPLKFLPPLPVSRAASAKGFLKPSSDQVHTKSTKLWTWCGLDPYLAFAKVRASRLCFKA